MKRSLTTTAAMLALALAGCGGGGALNLSGGSIPAGRSVQGVAILPDLKPLAGASVTAVTLPSTQPAGVDSTTDSNGRFALQSVPSASDVAITARRADGVTLKVIVSRASLAANPDRPLDIGQMNATTTLVCEAVERAANLLPEDSGAIIANQAPYLNDEAGHEGEGNEEEQHKWVTDPNYRAQKASAIIQKAANTEIDRLASAPDGHSAETALRGVNSFIALQRGTSVRPSGDVQDRLIQAQLNRAAYSTAVIAGALNRAGITSATPAAVSASSRAQRAALPALKRFGQTVSPYEALLIAAMPAQQGGLQLDRLQVESFLSRLLAP